MDTLTRNTKEMNRMANQLNPELKALIPKYEELQKTMSIYELVEIMFIDHYCINNLPTYGEFLEDCKDTSKEEVIGQLQLEMESAMAEMSRDYERLEFEEGTIGACKRVKGLPSFGEEDYHEDVGVLYDAIEEHYEKLKPKKKKLKIVKKKKLKIVGP